MSKEKLETGAMLNPKCQKCSKKDTCNNKTLCAYLIPIIEEMTNVNIGIDVGSGYRKQGYMKGGRR